MQNDEEDNIRARAIEPLQAEIHRLKRELEKKKIYNLIYENLGRIVRVLPFASLEVAQKYAQDNSKMWPRESWSFSHRKGCYDIWRICVGETVRYTILCQDIGE